MQIVFEETAPEEFAALKEAIQERYSRSLLVYDERLHMEKPFDPACPLKGGEECKTLENAAFLYSRMEAANLDTSSLLIACGGGTISDLAGFAAATYHRGIPLALIPTTLLAMVDAAIGGKNGVNFGGKKNAIGTLHHPRLVVINPRWLDTLPSNEYRQGLAEIVKYSILEGEEFLNYLEINCDSIQNRDLNVISDTIKRCIDIKLKIVEDSKKEPEKRDLLNFGHTFGHAIEAASHWQVPHGDSVAIGMLLSLKLSEKSGYIEAKLRERIKQLLMRFGLPVELPSLDGEEIFQWMLKDKKCSFGKICLILAKEIGKVSKFPDVSAEIIREVLHEKIAHHR